jgi:uncharacterized delta-60 repeat protein
MKASSFFDKAAALCAALMTAASMSWGQAPGTLDSSFGIGGSFVVSTSSYVIQASDLAIAPDGKMVAVGTTLSLGFPANRIVVMRLLADGTLDTTFGTGGLVVASSATNDLHGRCVAVAADGKILVGGHSGNFFVMVRLTSTGQFDATFGSGGLASISVGPSSDVQGISVGSDGKPVLVGSSLDSSGGSKRSLRTARFTTAGVADVTYGSSGVTTLSDGLESRVARCVRRLSTGELLIGGTQGVTTAAKGMVVRLLGTTGQVDNSFGTNGVSLLNNGVEAVTSLELDGTTADFFAVGPTLVGKDVALMRFRPAGNLDTNFSGDGLVSTSMGTTSDAPSGLVLRTDGRIYVASTATSGATTDFCLLRYQPDGVLDTALDGDGILTTPVGNGYDSAAGIRMQADGKLVMYGTAQATSASPVTGFAQLRYHAGALVTNVAPEITTQPAAATVARLSAASFTVVVNSSLIPVYQWFRNGVAIPTGTSATLSIPSAELTDEGSYHVEVTNAGGRAVSSAVTLTLSAPPVITTQPASFSGLGGGTHSFSVGAAGRSPFSYQWRKGGVDVPGATSSTFRLGKDEANEGLYSVVVTNSDGTVTSDAASLIVDPNPPSIVVQPRSQEAGVGQQPTLSIECRGRTPMTFVWKKNGTTIVSVEGSYYSTFEVPTSTTSDASYTCTVTNIDGTITSDAARVIVWPNSTARLPAYQLSPIGGSVSLTPQVFLTTSPIAYAWQFNGKNLPSSLQTGSTLQIDGVGLAQAGPYRAVVGTFGGTVTTSVCNFGVVDVGNKQLIGAAGKTVVLTANTAGAGLTYLWKKAGAPLAANTRYTGLTARSLSIAKMDAAVDPGVYSCEVSNPLGEMVETGEFTLIGVSAVPALTPTTLSAGVVASPYSAQLAASNSATKFIVTGLPSGLTCDAASGLISGSPRVAGNFSVKVIAENPVGKSPAVTLPLAVTHMPVNLSGTYVTLMGAGSDLRGGTATVTVTAGGVVTGSITLVSYTGAATTGKFSGLLTEFDSTYSTAPMNFTLPATFGGACSLTLSYEQGVMRMSGGSSSPDQSVTFTAGPMFTNPWNAKNNPATQLSGYNTCTVKGEVDSTASGSGFASCTVTAAGTFVLAGKLQDGTAIAIPSFVDARGSAMINAWLYKNKGQLSGTLSFSPSSPPQHYDRTISGSLSWSRPRVGDDEITYPYYAGFESAGVSVVGSRYLAPNVTGLSSAYMMNAGAGPGNVIVSISGGDVEERGSRTGNLSLKHSATGFDFSAGEHLRVTSLAFNAALGTFSGAFTRTFYYPEDHPRAGAVWFTRNIGFSGIVRRPAADGLTGSGEGYFAETLYVVLGDPESGPVTYKQVLFTGSISVSPAGF